MTDWSADPWFAEHAWVAPRVGETRRSWFKSLRPHALSFGPLPGLTNVLDHTVQVGQEPPSGGTGLGDRWLAVVAVGWSPPSRSALPSTLPELASFEGFIGLRNFGRAEDPRVRAPSPSNIRSEEHTSELQSR